MLKFLKICGTLVAVSLLAICVYAQTEPPPWREVTNRLQLQIDECRRDTRDLSAVERDIKDLQAQLVTLEQQIEHLLAGEPERAWLTRRWGRPGYWRKTGL